MLAAARRGGPAVGEQPAPLSLFNTNTALTAAQRCWVERLHPSRRAGHGASGWRATGVARRAAAHAFARASPLPSPPPPSPSARRRWKPGDANMLFMHDNALGAARTVERIVGARGGPHCGRRLLSCASRGLTVAVRSQPPRYDRCSADAGGGEPECLFFICGGLGRRCPAVRALRLQPRETRDGICNMKKSI